MKIPNCPARRTTVVEKRAARIGEGEAGLLPSNRVVANTPRSRSRRSPWRACGKEDADNGGSRVVEGVAEEGEAHHRHDRCQRRAAEVDRCEVHQDKAQKADACHVQEGAPGLKIKQFPRKIIRAFENHRSHGERAQDDQHQQIKSSFAFKQKQPPCTRPMRNSMEYIRLVRHSSVMKYVEKK